jgi:Gp5 N-terminal OB domain
MDSSFIGKDSFVWWKGVVEDRKDPIMLGRVKVRIFGHHSEDPQQIPTEDLPWASVSTPPDAGRNAVGFKEGDWVWGFFMDGAQGQWPIVVGLIPGIDEKPKAPELGFGDPTKPEDIKPDSFPRPPDINAQASQTESETESSSEQPKTGRFFNTDRVPGGNIAFGELCKYYDPENCKFDINGDGVFNLKDAAIMLAASSGIFGNKVFNGLSQIDTLSGGFFSKLLDSAGNIKITKDSLPPPPTTSPYPLADRLMEPTTSRLARNENIDSTIVGLKKGAASSITVAAFEGSGVGTQSVVAPASFEEPETPYAAKYPFNHVYESESGHFVEIDDTPGAERLHWYHRSGTFREIHPDGTQVTKVKKSDYNFIVEDYFCSSEKSLNLSATENLKANAASIILQTGSSFNRQVGSDENVSVDGDVNTRVKGTTHKVVEEESWTHVTDGAYFYVKDGDLHVKTKQKILIEAKENIQIKAEKTLLIDSNETLQISSKTGINLCAPTITLQGYGGGVTVINLMSFQIKSIFLQAHTAIVAGVAGWVWPPILMMGGLLVPGFPSSSGPVNPDVNKADNSDWYEDAPETASKKYGFVLPDAPAGTVWKPISDSDKNLVTLAGFGQPGKQQLFEALPTGVLEPVKIGYEHPDGTRTDWEVVRPIHTLGKEITNLFGAPRQDVFEDGRVMYRWPKPGKEYPKQLFLVIDGVANLILDSAVRHQASITGFGAEDLLDFDITKPGPEAGQEEAGSASPKYGYLFPKGAAQDVYKPTSDSNGKLCTLSRAGDTHELYEAIETDQVEAIKIKYLNINQSITEWITTRPVYRRGNLIEAPAIKTMFEDGVRFLCRFNKPGSEYPKNMFLVIKNNGVVVSEHFIIDSGARHMHTITYDEKVLKQADTSEIDNSEKPGGPSNNTKERSRSRRSNRQRHA